MANITVTCPSCGTVQEIDGSREFSFCSECGTKLEAAAFQASEPYIPEQEPVYIDTSSDDGILASLSQALKTEGNFVTNLDSADECAAQFDRWLALIEKFKETIPALSSDVNKESAINEILSFCDRVSKTKITFLSGEVGKDGKNQTKVYVPDKTRAVSVKDSKNFFISMFNNLPTRVELSMQLTEALDAANERLNKLKASVRETKEKYKASEKEFWSENPDVANRKREAKLHSLIIILVGAILAIIAIVWGCLKKNYLLFGAAAVILIVAFLIRQKSAKKSVRQIQLEFFPESLKQLGSLLESYEKEYEQAEIDQKNAQEKLAAFDASRK